MRRKLLALLALAPMMLVSCNPDTGNSSSSNSSVVSDSDSSTGDSSSSSTGGDETSDLTLTNYQKSGHVAFKVSTDSTLGSLLSVILGLDPSTQLNYSSDLAVTYTKADNVFQYSGENANFDLKLFPNQGYVKSSSVQDGTIEDAEAAQALCNIKTVGTAFTIFDTINKLVDPDITIDAPAYYRTNNSYFSSYSSATADDLAANPSNYSDVFGVTLLNGKSGYFTDVNPDVKASDGTHSLVRGYEEFSLGGEGGGSNIISTIMDLVGSLGSLGIDFDNLDIPGLINLIIPLIPTFDFDISSQPIAGYVGDVLDILLHGLTASFTENVDEVTGEVTRVLSLGLNADGLTRLGNFVTGIFADVLPASIGSMVSIKDVSEFGIDVSFVKGAGLSTYEFGGVSFDLGADISLLGAINGSVGLSFDLGFEPGETQVDDDYFTSLADDYSFYKGIHDQYFAFYTEISHYVKFASFDSIDQYIDLNDAELLSKLEGLQTEYEALPADVKVMFPDSMDVTAYYDEAVALFASYANKEIASDMTLDSMAELTGFPEWREYLGSIEGGATTIANLDAYIDGKISNKGSAYSAVVAAITAEAEVTLDYLKTAASTLSANASFFGASSSDINTSVFTADQLASWTNANIDEQKSLIVDQFITYFSSLDGTTSIDTLTSLYSDVYEVLKSFDSSLTDSISAKITEAAKDFSTIINTAVNALNDEMSAAIKAGDASGWNSSSYTERLTLLKAVNTYLNCNNSRTQSAFDNADSLLAAGNYIF